MLPAQEDETLGNVALAYLFADSSSGWLRSMGRTLSHHIHHWFSRQDSQCWTLLINPEMDFFFPGPHLRHKEVPRLGVRSELQLPAYNTATAIADLSCVRDLHHSSQQRWILDPLSKARDRTHNLMVPNRICFPCTTTGTPRNGF